MKINLRTRETSLADPSGSSPLQPSREAVRAAPKSAILNQSPRDIVRSDSRSSVTVPTHGNKHANDRLRAAFQATVTNATQKHAASLEQAIKRLELTAGPPPSVRDGSAAAARPTPRDPIEARSWSPQASETSHLLRNLRRCTDTQVLRIARALNIPGPPPNVLQQELRRRFAQMATNPSLKGYEATSVRGESASSRARRIAENAQLLNTMQEVAELTDCCGVPTGGMSRERPVGLMQASPRLMDQVRALRDVQIVDLNALAAAVLRANRRSTYSEAAPFARNGKLAGPSQRVPELLKQAAASLQAELPSLGDLPVQRERSRVTSMPTFAVQFHNSEWDEAAEPSEIAERRGAPDAELSIDDGGDEESKAILKEFAAEGTPVAQKKPRWTSRVGAWLTGKFSAGHKLEPTELSLKIYESLNKGNDDAPEWSGEGDILGRFGQLGDKPGLVTRACHDLPVRTEDVRKSSAGNRSIADVVGAHTGFGQSCRLLIPVCQSNTDWLGRRRGHFTLLDADIENGRLRSATLYDPKGSMSFAYAGTRHIEAQLLERGVQFSGEIKLQKLSHQKLLNVNDCGRFVASYINEFATGSKSISPRRPVLE